MAFNFLNKIPNLVQQLGSITSIQSGKGNVVSFFYTSFKHDPYPIILTSGLMSHGRVGGLNLHYLSFPVFKALLNQWAGNGMFDYQIIKNQKMISQAFRSYKIEGIKTPKLINWKAIVEVLSVIRNYSQEEMRKIVQSVDQQVISRQPEILNELLGNLVQENNPAE